MNNPHNSNRLAYQNVPSLSPDILDQIFSKLVDKVSEERIRSVILVGSFARSEQTPYSDIDICCFVDNATETVKHFIYQHKRLIEIAIRTITQYREALTRPEQAIFIVPNMLVAKILLDKDGSFHAFQQELMQFRWEPLQPAADQHASWTMMRLAEHAHKVLSGFKRNNLLLCADVVAILFMALGGVVGVQRGILAKSGNAYSGQVQEAIGQDSPWTRYHRQLAGLETASGSITIAEMRSIAALRLYQETARILWPVIQPEHRDIVEPTLQAIDEMLGNAERI